MSLRGLLVVGLVLAMLPIVPGAPARQHDVADCPAGDVWPSDAGKALTLTLRIRNEGGPGHLRVCMFGGASLLMVRTLRVPPTATQEWDLRFDTPVDAITADHPDATNQRADDLARWFDDCPHAAEFEIDYSDRILKMATQEECGGAEFEPATRPDTVPALEDRGGLAHAVAASIAVVGLGVLLWRYRSIALAFFARLVGQRVLDHETRQRICQLIERRPALRAHEIAQELELPESTLAHHLWTLCRERILVTAGPRLSRHYFLAGRSSPRAMAQQVALRNEGLASFLREVRRRPGATLGDVAAAVGVKLPTASRYVRRLQDVQALRTERHGAFLRLYSV